MFVALWIDDTVRVAPDVFNEPLESMLRVELEAKYAGKVRGSNGPQRPLTPFHKSLRARAAGHAGHWYGYRGPIDRAR